MDAQELSIGVGDERVSGLLLRPPNATALYLFAHGAGTGMTHKAMESNAQGLGRRGIATLRFQFLYMEKGSHRPDPPRLAHAAVRAAGAEATRADRTEPHPRHGGIAARVPRSDSDRRAPRQ